MKKYSAAVLALFAASTLIAAQTAPPNTPAPAPGQEQTPPPETQPQQERPPAAEQEHTAPAVPSGIQEQPTIPVQPSEQEQQASPEPPPEQLPPASPEQPLSEETSSAPERAAPPQPSPAETEPTQLPPFPALRNVITTEKTIPGKPDGVIPRVRPEDSLPDETDAHTPPEETITTTAPDDSAKTAVLPPRTAPQAVPQTPRGARPSGKKTSETYREERNLFNTPTANLRTAKAVIDDEYNFVGMVYGEQLGFIRILEADDDGNLTEVWKSPPLNSEVRGVFVANLDQGSEAEIVAYTLDGNIFIFGYDSRELKYKTPDGMYPGIRCMLIANLDSSPELELLFITTEGRMVQFDTASRFEEWTSTETYDATDMIIGNVDNDRDPEIILNSGEILSYQFKSLKWRMDPAHVRPNSRLYLMDVDNDGILELIVEYDQQYIRIFDIDQRREKW